MGFVLHAAEHMKYTITPCSQVSARFKCQVMMQNFLVQAEEEDVSRPALHSLTYTQGHVTLNVIFPS